MHPGKNRDNFSLVGTKLKLGSDQRNRLISDL
jgi:hypothetical protein